MSRKTGFLLAALLQVALLPASAALATPLYHLTPIGILPTGRTSSASAINDAGQVVGSADLPGIYGDGQIAVLYSGGRLINLGAANNGGSSAYASAISSNGYIAGVDGFNRAFRYFNGNLIDLGSLSTMIDTSGGSGVNSSGVVVGNTQVGSSVHAFMDNGSVMTDLGTLTGSGVSEALAINDAGQIVGYSAASGGAEHAFLWQSGVMSDLGATAQFPSSFAEAISGNGAIAGFLESSSETTFDAFLDTGGVMHDLGTLPGQQVAFATGVNDSGEVIGKGYVFSGASASTPFVLLNGKLQAISPLLDSSGNGWTLTSVTGINDNGWIVGDAVSPSGVNEGVILMPVPEPCGMSLFVCGATGIAIVLRRRRGSEKQRPPCIN
jgi:probable HAF family extracellular repeat protein